MSVLLRPVFIVTVLDGTEDRRSGPEQMMTPLLSLVNPGVVSLFLTHLNLISLSPNTLPRDVYGKDDLCAEEVRA